MSTSDKSTWPTLTIGDLARRVQEALDVAAREVYVVMPDGTLRDVISAKWAAVDDVEAGTSAWGLEIGFRQVPGDALPKPGNVCQEVQAALLSSEGDPEQEVFAALRAVVEFAFDEEVASRPRLRQMFEEVMQDFGS